LIQKTDRFLAVLYTRPPMPNVCIVARASGQIESTEVDNWPDFEFIRSAVGGMFTQVPTTFRMEFDDSLGSEAGEQATVVYCSERAALMGLPQNPTGFAATINRDIGDHAPLLGDLLIVSGDDAFMATQD